MKVQINDLILDNVVLIEEPKEVLLRTKTTDLSPLLSEIIGSVTIHQLDDDNNVVWSVEGDFKQSHIFKREKYTTMYCPKVITEPPTLQQQITDIELALCEIFEKLEG